MALADESGPQLRARPGPVTGYGVHATIDERARPPAQLDVRDGLGIGVMRPRTVRPSTDASVSRRRSLLAGSVVRVAGLARMQADGDQEVPHRLCLTPRLRVGRVALRWLGLRVLL